MKILSPKILLFAYTLTTFLGIINLSLLYVQKHNQLLVPETQTLSISQYSKTHEKVVYGFLPYWTLNKADYIQLDKLTDVAYFALSINADGSIRKIGNDGNLDPGYNNWKNNETLDNFIERAKEANVQVALTIISHEPDVSDSFLDCKKCWTKLYEELDTELKEKGLRAINVDFEYPEYTEKEKALQYSEFIAYLNTELDKSNHNGVQVVVSTFADAVRKPRITDIPTLSKAADGLFIMAYDFHYTGSERAGPVAPVNGSGKTYAYDINTMIVDYMRVMSPSKLILGVPYYGYNWVVDSPSQYAARIPGDDYVGYSQSQTYENIMETILDLNPKILWDKHALAPYFSYISPASGVNRQVFFENQESLKIKYELVHKYGLKGVGIWALGYDGGYQELWNALEEKFGS